MVCGIGAVVVTAIFQPTICLSVLVGGVMGAANLWLWARVVRLLVANAAGEAISVSSAAAQCLLKLLALVGVIGVASILSVDVLGLAIGFGATLAGAMIAWLSQKV